MKIVPRILTLLLCFLPAACSSNAPTPAKKDTVVAPAKPPERRVSAEMRRTLEQLQVESGLPKLSSWRKLRAMPAWTLDRAEQREYASIEKSPLVMDGFSHLVIIGKNRRTIVVRTGGFAGVNEIWEEPEEPSPVDQARLE